MKTIRLGQHTFYRTRYLTSGRRGAGSVCTGTLAQLRRWAKARKWTVIAIIRYTDGSPPQLVSREVLHVEA